MIACSWCHYSHLSTKQLYWAREASPSLGYSIDISHDIYTYVSMSVCLGKSIQKICVPKCVGGIMWPKHAHPQCQFLAVKTDL